ncbi:MAG: hypothetical protein FRX48_01801 [Lasallia pustulata]|uniref:Uncharacterized protein n=1 Tax=Lasallia pustulata TaxID=136370 RepID=A0A5M8Q1F3_9LECA|nr:MAG: hypothetical protein FRX48_01801 [Lasallia pustulata]
MGRAQRPKGRKPPSFYLEQRAQLAAQGKKPPKLADNTKKGLASILKKWGRFCSEFGYNPETFLTDAQVPDFKLFWKWTMDRYNRIGVDSSLKNYWRVLRMHALDKADRDFDPRERRDIRNYINLLIDEVKIEEPDGLDVPTDDTAAASAQGGRRAVNDIKMDASNQVKSNRNGDFNTPWDSHGDSDSDSGCLYNCDEYCDTDDDCDAGPEATRSFKMLVIGGGEDDPLFSLLGHFISLAVHDDAFEATYAKNIENMIRVKRSSGRKSLTLKWKSRVLDLPVFREPLRSAREVGTSPTEPLLASTWIRYLKQLGQKAGFQQSFTQYGLRRGLLNVVNNSAPASVRDQIFAHKQGAVGYYLDQEIRFYTESCYLGKPSSEVVQKMARLASLTANANAPRELSSEQKAKLIQHPQVIRLDQRNKALTAQIHAAGYKTICDAEGTSLFKEKKKVEARPGDGLSDREELRRRIQAIKARADLCNRRETQRRGQPKSTAKQEESEGAVKESKEDAKEKFPMVCRPTQCLFCLGDERLPYLHRVFEYAKPNRMMNEVGKHLERLAPEDQVPCPHPQCKAAGLVLPTVMDLKNHTATVHKIFLRA